MTEAENEILLEEAYEDGVYKGKIVIHIEDLTAEMLGRIKNQPTPKWKEYKKILKKRGYDV